MNNAITLLEAIMEDEGFRALVAEMRSAQRAYHAASKTEKSDLLKRALALESRVDGVLATWNSRQQPLFGGRK